MINPALIYVPTGGAVTTKYMFSRSAQDVSTAANVIAGYDEAYTDAGDIQTNQGIGTPAILATVLTYVEGGAFLSENVNLDATDATTFLNDINGWLYANNFNYITYDGGLDKYVIAGTHGNSYLHILYI